MARDIGFRTKSQPVILPRHHDLCSYFIQVRYQFAFIIVLLLCQVAFDIIKELGV